MRVIVIGIAAALGLVVGSVSAVAAAGKHVTPVSQYDVASRNVDLAQAKLHDGDVTGARAHLETAKASTAACDADAKCKARPDHFNLHARLDQTARRVALWEKR